MTTAIAKVIDQINQAGAFKGVDLANITDVSAPTFSRWKQGKATPDTRKQLILSDLRYVVDSLSEFYAPDEIRLWLFADNQLLDGKKAIDLIQNQETEKVLEAIERLSSHAYL